MNSTELAQLIENLLDEKKGEHITKIDLQDRNALVDYMIVASASSNRQLVAMADYIHHALKQRDIVSHIEGLPSSDWILIDTGDIMVHLFKPDARTYYNLEKMWNGALQTGTPSITVL